MVLFGVVCIIFFEKFRNFNYLNFYKYRKKDSFLITFEQQIAQNYQKEILNKKNID